jgi:ATP-dependent Lon protease
MKRTSLKRKYESDDESDKDDYDFDDPFIVDDLTDRKQTKQEKILSADMEKVKQEMMNRELDMQTIFELGLPMEENVWFAEHIRILKSQEDESEDRYRIKNMIYDRYKQLKNVDRHKLKKIRDDADVERDIVSKIVNSDHSDIVKSILYKKYTRAFENSNKSSDELFKVIEWIDNVLDLPTKVTIHSKVTIDEKLKKLWNSLNRNITGLIHVKEKIMETMCAKLLDPNNGGKILTLVGEPGVGKTAVALSIAESLDMPFDQISFGSIKDSSVLTGHSSTYIGAVPGLFASILLKSKRLDMVVLLDEIDKIPDTPEGKSISAVLLHVLDRTQNSRFRDMYMPEVPLDLSKIIFMLAANSLDDIDPVVRDRMTIIKIDGYSLSEKADIVETHMYPRISKELGFSVKDLVMTRSIIEYIIRKTKEQAGMREVERAFYQLCERLSLLKHSKGINLSYKMGNIKFPLKVTTNIVVKLID